MGEANAKLNHLASSNPLLPRARDVEKGKSVVPIHNHMDETVHASAEVAITASFDLANQKPSPNEEDVMVAMQERNLIVLLSQNHPHSVKQLNVLVVVVNPNQEANAERRAARNIDVTPHALENRVGVNFVNHSNDAPKVQNALVQVVGEDVGFNLEWFASFHVLNSVLHDKQVRNREKDGTTPPNSLEWISVGFFFQIMCHNAKNTKISGHEENRCHQRAGEHLLCVLDIL